MAYSDAAATMIQAYGNYPVATTFARADSVPDLPESEVPAYDAAFDVDPSAKRHAACDECRKRKLKCSGEPSGCGRCLKQTLTCHYSLQSKMGRPRKRQRMDTPPDTTTLKDNDSDKSRSQGLPPPLEPAIDPQLSEKAIERTNFENICNAPISQSVRRAATMQNTQDTNPQSQGSSSTSPPDAPRTPPDADGFSNVSYPTDVSQWPDFSDMTMLPMLVQDSHEHGKDGSVSTQHAHLTSEPTGSSSFPFDPDANPTYLTQLPPVPACPCLPNLYLTLSTLSTLSAFPVSSGTIDTLLNAHSTGRAVIYCGVCPQKFQTGSQNVMLASMLITVLSDHWHRVKKATAAELRTGFSTGSETGGEDMSAREKLEWRTFGYNMIRACVFGDASFPNTPGSNTRSVTSSPLYTLCQLCGALERRQKQWHSLETATGEFPGRLTDDLFAGHTMGLTLDEMKEIEAQVRVQGDDELLCLRIIKHARAIMRSLESGAPRLGDV